MFFTVALHHALDYNAIHNVHHSASYDVRRAYTIKHTLADPVEHIRICISSIAYVRTFHRYKDFLYIDDTNKHSRNAVGVFELIIMMIIMFIHASRHTHTRAHT